jgi:hypothetical protein
MKAKRKPATKAKRKPAAKVKTAAAHEAEFYRRLGEAYREQEDPLGDLLTMAEIAARASLGNVKGEAIFTAHHLRDMIDDFRQEWYDQHKASGAGGDEGAVS